MGEPDPAPDLSRLREELLASVGAAFDRAVEAAWRQGAEAAAQAAAKAALASLAGSAFGAPAGMATPVPVPPGLPRRDVAAAAPPAYPSSPAQAGFLPEPAVPERAPSGAVQDGVLIVLEHATTPLTPLGIVAAGRDMGLALKGSSVGMALRALERRGRVAKDGRHGFRLVPGGAAESGGELPHADTPGADTNPE